MAGRAVIIESALNGLTGRDRNPHVPYTPDEIAADAADAAGAGASVVHFHARDDDGGWSHDVERYAATFRALRARCDVLAWPTFAGAGDAKAYAAKLKKVLGQDPLETALGQDSAFYNMVHLMALSCSGQASVVLVHHAELSAAGDGGRRVTHDLHIFGRVIVGRERARPVKDHRRRSSKLGE